MNCVGREYRILLSVVAGPLCLWLCVVAGGRGGCFLFSVYGLCQYYQRHVSACRLRLGEEGKSDVFVNSYDRSVFCPRLRFVYDRSPEARKRRVITRVIAQVLVLPRKPDRSDYSGEDGLEQGQPSDRDPRA